MSNRALCLIALLLFPCVTHAAIVLSYSVTNNAIGSGFASGAILDNATQIGSWSLTGFAFTTRTTNSVPPYAPTIGTVAINTPNNTYGKPGIGILISGDGNRENGVMSFQYSVSWSLNAGYTLDSASFWGKYPNTVGFYGPAEPVGTGGSISLSGFTGQGIVSDPTDNLQAADGYLFNSGEDLNGWNVGVTQGTPVAQVNWQLTAPAANSYTYIVDYDGQGLSSANEGTAFNLNISPVAGVPEPGTWLAGALLLGCAAILKLRRRRTA